MEGHGIQEPRFVLCGADRERQPGVGLLRLLGGGAELLQRRVVGLPVRRVQQPSRAEWSAADARRPAALLPPGGAAGDSRLLAEEHAPAVFLLAAGPGFRNELVPRRRV